MFCEVEDHVCKGNVNECVCTECADKGTADVPSKSHSLPRFKISSLEFISPAQLHSPSFCPYPISAARRHATQHLLSCQYKFSKCIRNENELFCCIHQTNRQSNPNCSFHKFLQPISYLLPILIKKDWVRNDTSLTVETLLCFANFNSSLACFIHVPFSRDVVIFTLNFTLDFDLRTFVQEYYTISKRMWNYFLYRPLF